MAFQRVALFIGGSDARIIMGSDEAAQVRLWREKRGEADGRTCPATSLCSWARRRSTLTEPGTSATPAGGAFRDVQRRVKHSAIPWMAATLDGVVEETEAVVETQVHAALVFLRRGRCRKVHGPVQHNMWVTHLRT